MCRIPISDLYDRTYEAVSTAIERDVPVYLTEDGRDVAVVISADAYERLTARYELFTLLAEGHRDVMEGRTIPFDDAMKALYEEFRNADMPS